MTLIEIIKKLGLDDKDIYIEYRTYAPTGHNEVEDILAGMCKWENRKLSPMDGDFYDLADEINKYEFNDDILTVWYKSQWWRDGEWIDVPFPEGE